MRAMAAGALDDAGNTAAKPLLAAALSDENAEVTPPPACPKTGILPEAGGRLNGGIKPPFLKEYMPIPPTGVDGILYGVKLEAALQLLRRLSKK